MDEEATGLQEILNSEPSEGTEETLVDNDSEVTEEDKGEEKEGESPAPEEEKEEEPVKPDVVDEHRVPRKALIEERKKRQQAQKEASELFGELKALKELQQQRPAEAEPEEPDTEDLYWQDPAAYISDLEKRVQANQKQMAEKFQTAMSEMSMRTKIEIGKEIMRSMHEDFDDYESEFVEMAQKDPYLRSQFMQHSNPAEFAYKYMQMHKQVQDLGDLDQFRDKIRQEERSKLEKEFMGQSSKVEAAQVTTSSAGARSAGQAPTARDLSLGDILDGR